jgi:hypothetical protein
MILHAEATYLRPEGAFGEGAVESALDRALGGTSDLAFLLLGGGCAWVLLWWCRWRRAARGDPSARSWVPVNAVPSRAKPDVAALLPQAHGSYVAHGRALRQHDSSDADTEVD